MKSGKIKKINLSFFKNIFWFLASHAFVTVLFLIFLDIIIGAVIFYKYAITDILVLKTTTQPTFKYEMYQKVIDSWGERAEKFNKQ
jgi:hypothetical protein